MTSYFEQDIASGQSKTIKIDETLYSFSVFFSFRVFFSILMENRACITVRSRVVMDVLKMNNP